MKPLTPEHALSLWHLAAQQELGLRIPVPEGESVQSAMNRMYEARAANPSPDIDEVSLRMGEGELILFKKTEARLEL